MALTKVTYVEHSTVITAANLNAIQDEIIDKCNTVEQKTFTAAQKSQARTNIGAVSSSDVDAKSKAVVCTTPSFNSLPQTFTDSQLAFEGSISHITTDLICKPGDYILSNPQAMGGDWTVNTNTAGQVTISGTFSGSAGTTLKLFLSHE